MRENMSSKQLLFCVIFLRLQIIDYGQAKPLQRSEDNLSTNIDQNILLEGDMILDRTVLNVISSQTVSTQSKRSAVANGVKLWPGGIVPYTIDSQLGSSARNAIYNAISEIHRKTCIRFKSRKYEYSYVNFIKGSGCYSYVGRVGGRQVISLGSGCETKGTALHEMMHALGFFHTSSRTDRDSYVIVFGNNVAPGKQINFQKYPHGQIDSLGSPYDITSIMHLPRQAFAKAKGLYTIVARAGAHIILGQSERLTPVDSYQLNALYNCVSKAGCLTALGLQSGVIKDAAMRASSAKNMYSPGQGRLHNFPSRFGRGAWCSDSNDRQPWIEVDLGHVIRVTGIATQGLLSFYKPAYTINYVVEYRRSIYENWTKYQSLTRAYGFTPNLPGNWDETSVQYNALTPSLYAKYVRIMPSTWFGAPCIRFEIYGCKV